MYPEHAGSFGRQVFAAKAPGPLWRMSLGHAQFERRGFGFRRLGAVLTLNPKLHGPALCLRRSIGNLESLSFP